MNYNLSFGRYSGIFALPTQAADKYINEASQNDFKVLLYVFRHSGEKLETASVCSALAIDEKQFENSLEFWQQRGIFDCSAQKKAEKPAVRMSEKSEPRREQQKTREMTAARKIIDAPMQYGQEDIAKKSQTNPEIKFLLETVPSQLGRLISPAECSTLVYLYEGAGLPADVIIMIVGYCVSCGKGNIRYIEKMALGWAEDGIDNYERAENKIRELEKRRGFEGQIRSIMGINDRALSPTEKQHIARWCGWNMPVELVKLAYDICAARTGKLSFSYINSILNSWHEKGFTTVEQAKNENRRGKGKGKGSGGKASYDIDEYVRLSMNALHNE